MIEYLNFSSTNGHQGDMPCCTYAWIIAVEVHLFIPFRVDGLMQKWLNSTA